MIDPTKRWKDGIRPEYAGLPTWSAMPYTEDAAELAGADVAIVGAPMDELASGAPGTRSRAAGDPRGELPAGPAPRGGESTATPEELRVMDFGDAPVIPADAARAHTRAIEATVARGAGRGRDPDRARRRPLDRRARRACLRRRCTGRWGWSTSTPTPTPAREVFGVEVSHGTPMYRLVEAGHVGARPLRADRAARLLAGRGGVRLAGASAGSTSLFMHDVRERGIRAVVGDAIAAVGAGPDIPLGRRRRPRPRLRPRHRHAGAGRHDLRRPALGVPGSSPPDSQLVGADVVEVLPTASRLARRHRAGGRPDRPRGADRASPLRRRGAG